VEGGIGPANVIESDDVPGEGADLGREFVDGTHGYILVLLSMRTVFAGLKSRARDMS